MGSLIDTFQIDFRLLLAQVINFAIVLFVLWHFAYRPLLRIINDRTQRIEKGLDDAREAQERLEQITFEREQRILEAKKEAQRIIAKAAEDAKKEKEAMIIRAKEDVGKIVMDGKAELDREKRSALQEIKSEAADVVLLAVKKVLEHEVDAKKNEEIIRKAIAHFKKEKDAL